MMWLATNNVFFLSSYLYNNYNLWSCQNVCDTLIYILLNIFIRFGTNLYRQTVGIPMGTNCAPFVAFFSFVSSLLWKRFHEVSLKGKSRENLADTVLKLSSPLQDTLMFH